MIKLIALLMILSSSIISFSQGFIGDSREKVKNKLGKYINQENITASFEENDSSIILHLKDLKFKLVDFKYQFNNNNKCVSEIKYACDTCVRKYFIDAIKTKKFHWRQVNSTTYVSRYSHQLIMELLSENGIFSLSIRKINSH